MKIKVDGVDVEVGEQAFQIITKAREDADKARSELKKAEDGASKANARADKADEDLAAANKSLEEASSPEKTQAIVKARLSLVRDAEKILGNTGEVKIDELSDSDIKRDVVLKMSPGAADKLDAADEVYLDARFDQEIESFGSGDKDKDKGNYGLSRLRLAGNSHGVARNDVDDARNKMIERNREAGLAPLPNSVSAS